MNRNLGIKSLQLLQQYRKLTQKRAEGLSADEEKELQKIEHELANFIDPESSESFAHKRKALRVNAEFTVTIADKSELNRLYIKNISGGGLFVATTQLQEMGKKFKILLQLPGQKDSHEVEVEVAWISPKAVGHLPPGMGVKFVNPSVELRQQVDRLIEHKVQRSLEELHAKSTSKKPPPRKP